MMLPQTDSIVSFETGLQQPDLTYKMDLSKESLRGRADQIEAVKQAIYKALSTERYEYPIYSWNYGVELLDLIGQPAAYVRPELKRRIEEALLQDDRIQGVDGFEFEQSGQALHVTFTAHTKYGEISAGKEVTV